MNPQLLAADPSASVFVTANAGSGKTSTLVDRVARLLLRGAAPQAILCVTYTKAAAAEMQRRLFAKLGDWAVMEDAALTAELARIDEAPTDLSAARALFARALETPGGLKIQTIHAFCEKLLRRFPVEAGVSPNFTVLEDSAAAEVSAEARDDVARLALADPDGAVGRAYAHLSVEVDFRSFELMFGAFEARREAIAAYVDACDGDVEGDVWQRLGFDAPTGPDAVRDQALAALNRPTWRAAAQALYASGKYLDCAEVLATIAEGAGDFDTALSAFCTKAGEPATWVDKAAAIKSDPGLQSRLLGERDKLFEARERCRAAVIARDTVHVLTLAYAYREVYEGAKARTNGLDFADLIARVHELLTVRADAAWVLFKLDGGIDHLLLDEAQDTAPDQWDILRALTAEFFSGSGANPRPRSVFAVGDEKQSIYSFQGAAPERFLNEAQGHQSLIEGLGGLFRQVPLETSYRSTPQVLEFVDAVFAPPEVLAALRPLGPAESDIVTHKAFREDAGCVDLWPLEEGDVAEETDPWAPVDIEPPEGANKRLARRIASQVKAMIDRREAVIDKKTRQPRPMTPGDVLILVRRRKALFHEIIRALKKAGVPVGGQDRLTLSEHIVFKDLLALARFALFQTDDLTLAALLRSPFCDLDEQSLYDLAQPREASLWGELARRSGERPEWEAAHAFLSWAREAAALGPFDFYGRVLSRLDPQGRSMRARLLTRLGREAEDALDAFLAECLAAEQRGERDLETFAAAMASTEIEVKREQEDADGRGPGEVRVMTVHGAKGLEAPVVILPDTTSAAKAQGSPLFRTLDGGFLWAPRKADDCELSGEVRQARDLATAHESLRLLYVALTRARDRLILCGVKRSDRKSGYETGCWHETILQALGRPDIANALRTIDVDGLEITRFGPDPEAAPASAVVQMTASALPSWAHAEAPEDPAALKYSSPSQMAETIRGPAPSPLAQAGGLGRFRRGDIIHRLLQLLPDLAPAERPAAAERLLAKEPGLTDEQRAEMAAAAFAVLDDPQFAEVFGPGSRAEAAIAGTAKALPSGLAVSGRVDRLLVTPTRVLVVDYKTNRPAPSSIEEADEAYRIQMAVYVAVLREVFPGRAVEAALVWTDGPKLMPVPENVVAQTLARLG
ncbi:MAG: double-strand break repair helicase AddA [Parcubacteria group bacterium]